MIAHLRGKLVERNIDHVIVEVSGVGYLVSTSIQSIQALPPVGSEVFMYTYLHVREDAHTLFGFVSQEEKNIFERCISVSGIGPKLALVLLSGFEVPQLIEAVQQGQIARLSTLPGIGKKTAERLILELRDKLGPRRPISVPGGVQGEPRSSVVQDVVTALCNLGYRLVDAEKATQLSVKENPQAGVEPLLRAALRHLQRGM